MSQAKMLGAEAEQEIADQIERFNSYVPDMHGQGMGIYSAADGKYVRFADHEHIVKELTSEREQIAQMVERMYGPHDRRFKTAIQIADAIRGNPLRQPRNPEPRRYCAERDGGCGVEVTSTDFEAGYCTNCRKEL